MNYKRIATNYLETYEFPEDVIYVDEDGCELESLDYKLNKYCEYAQKEIMVSCVVYNNYIYLDNGSEDTVNGVLKVIISKETDQVVKSILIIDGYKIRTCCYEL